MASLFFGDLFFLKHKKRPSRRAVTTTAPTIIATRTPVLKVTPVLAVAPSELAAELEVELGAELAPTPFVVVAPDLAIELVKVLAKVDVRVVVWTFAVMMVVYDEVQTEKILESRDGGAV